MSKKTRRFLPYDFKIDKAEQFEKYLVELSERVIETKSDLENFIFDYGEIYAVASEDMAWRYINMTIDTRAEKWQNAYSDFVKNIQPLLSKYTNIYDKKIHESPLKKNLLKKEGFEILFRNTASSIELFREENIPLQSKQSEKSKEYGAVSAAMSVEIEGKKLTLQAAGKYLQNTNRDVRKEAYTKIQERRKQDTEKLHLLLDELIEIRQEIAKNAGFDNYVDYRFKALGRFDYGLKECQEFHESAEKEIVPILDKLYKIKKEELGLDTLKPYDLSATPEGQEPLKPFEGADDLIEKSRKIFYKIDEDFGKGLDKLVELKHLDLESKEGKAPGGYNYPLYETGVPFIFMNAVGTHSDMITMMHEGGHAVHSVLTQTLPTTQFKSFPSEIAELASMSTELLSMPYWDEFYPEAEDLKKAKKDQLFRVIEVLPWVALIDAFQIWLYQTPGHTHQEREEKWTELFNRFTSSEVDYSELEQYIGTMWQKQLHIYEVPFYYIEYGIAQLGAIGVWKNSVADKEKATYHFKKALMAGNMFSLPDTYQKAKVPFDFSQKRISVLAKFVMQELDKLT